MEILFYEMLEVAIAHQPLYFLLQVEALINIIYFIILEEVVFFLIVILRISLYIILTLGNNVYFSSSGGQESYLKFKEN
jgi:hypothetical protein